MDHPNLPHVLGVFFQQERPASIRPCVVFELATSDLQKYLIDNRRNKISSQDMTKIARDVANGIAALHTYNIVHGDVKLDNILLFKRNGMLIAAIADLGSSGITTSASGAINGAISYCAPEYHRKSRFAEHANEPSRDVYNYGLILWSIMTYCKSNPFPQKVQFEMQHNDDAAIPFLIQQVARESLVPIMGELMRQCLQCDPKDRPSIFDVSNKIGLEV
jgi:serine/threonine protein kinase